MISELLPSGGRLIGANHYPVAGDRISKIKALCPYALQIGCLLDRLNDEVFEWIRFKVRFEAIFSAAKPAKDGAALIADTEEDTELNRVVEECMNVCGFSTLRVLASLRQLGGVPATMGFYAFICNDTHLQNFITLVHLQQNDAMLYTQKHFTSVQVMQLAIKTKESIWLNFAKLKSVPPSDIQQRFAGTWSLKTIPILDHLKATTELMQLEQQSAGSEWPPVLRCARMLKQSVMMKDAALRDSLYLNHKLRSVDGGDTPLAMDRALQGGDTLYAAYTTQTSPPNCAVRSSVTSTPTPTCSN